MKHRATYTPEDNKIRIYPAFYLEKEDYDMLKNAGFGWAPKQKIFIAPMWTPQRAQIAFNFCGDIQDEDNSILEIAEDRAERFKGYKEKRLNEAIHAKDNLNRADTITARTQGEAERQAKKLENEKEKAVKLWETSQYWERRAKGVLLHKKYIERSDVRARRIKKIEALRRKRLKSVAESEKFINLWNSEKVELTLERACNISGYEHFYMCFPLSEYPREPPASQYEGDMSIYSALTDNIITVEHAKTLSISKHQDNLIWCEKWVNHCDNRLTYEKILLDEAGASDLLKPAPRAKQLPICNYKAPEGVKVAWYGNEEVLQQKEMTKDEFKKIWHEQRGTRHCENSHRVRIGRSNDIMSNWFCVFLTDSKTHKKPEPVELNPPPQMIETRSYYKPPEKTEFDDLKEEIKTGIKAVSAPQLFPTPPNIVDMMLEHADIQPGDDVLEPSGGTGNIVKKLPCIRPDGALTIVEINQGLSDSLKDWGDVNICDDFLNCNGNLNGKFDKILMNPPFKNGEDIKHINHALKYLKEGGTLVAICANGSRQQAAFYGVADLWEDLPAGSFKDSGTNVNTAMVVFNY